MPFIVINEKLLVFAHRERLSTFMAMRGSLMTLNPPLNAMERNTLHLIS